MQSVASHIRFSASDLVGHLDCPHLTALDATVARGTAVKPKIWDPVLETLAERGRAHERQYVEKLKESGFSVAEIEGGGVTPSQVYRTIEAMLTARGFDASTHLLFRSDSAGRIV